MPLLSSVPYSEKELLLRVSNGDEAAFRQLFYQFHHRLGIFIYQVTASHELAEEIVQDVFLKIWTERKQLTTVHNFNAWLYILSKNQALNALRKIVNERRHQQRWSQEQRETEWTEDGSFTDAAIDLLDKAVQQLPPQQQKVFILSRYQRLTYQDIAQQLNLSRETVKYYLRLAMQSIAQYMTNHTYLLWLVLLGGL
ncbi:RNA polymerase sigma-70 factor, ECF subfamily [Filimonas lacunae]|uniref:RNA polymerase sigma-70 factor, ECF subfamily n=1 Tax=Filimonas lacunae TaxID=477680 RepID=A0A173MPK0_9BACT|nr:RNA polymerase sigma-70 factor [Filimonas lacunae]BAV09416.1 RNA polymerase ECF-type sigma factor [Filimonas lacunae]SIS72734.1 RNA polymerase sigma-70 factor, ECF subfamily [Filimonas lacunae]